MPEKSELFWQRVKELAKNQIRPSAYEYYVLEAQLLNVEDNQVHILLDSPVKKLFWDQNLLNVVITAGFEIYDQEVKITYHIADKKKIQETPELEKKSDPGVSKELNLPRVNPNINPKYTFDNFIQGEGNAWAKSAAIAVADKPGGNYNPLFIYGGSGLGKTHLLNAIANEILKDKPRARIKYVATETFINDFIEHIRLDQMDEFKANYRNLDLLLIDDIQSLKNKASTQEEFFNTFNDLYMQDKQIVLTSDRPPASLEDLEDRLVTRFSWGLTVDITPPDFETRIAILRSKIEAFDFEFTDDTLSYLAGQFKSNVRDLEGALKNINLLATAKQLEIITVDTAVEAIRARKQENVQISVIPIEKIQQEVGNFYGVSVKEIKGTKRVQNIVLARQVAIYLSRELTDNSLPKIGKEFGNRDHSTVLHAYNKIRGILEKDNNLTIELQTIRNKIK